MSSSLRKVKMPNAGIFDADGTLNAAGHAFLEQLSVAVASIQDQLNAAGTLGALSSLDSIDRPHLASGFGSIIIADTEIASTTVLVTCATNIPSDDTIPQSSEGNQVLAGSYTPVSGSSLLRIHIEVALGKDGNPQTQVCAALFQDSGTDAVATAIATLNAGYTQSVCFDYWLSSPAAGMAIAFAVNVGAGANTAYVNGNGSRFYGGSMRSFMRVTEYEAS